MFLYNVYFIIQGKTWEDILIILSNLYNSIIFAPKLIQINLFRSLQIYLTVVII
jgi:hypothetical protein